jgi:hypothetical protein
MAEVAIESKDFLGYTVRGLDPFRLEHGDRFVSRVFGIYEVLDVAHDSVPASVPKPGGVWNRIRIHARRLSTGEEREIWFYEGEVADPVTGTVGDEPDPSSTDELREPEEFR